MKFGGPRSLCNAGNANFWTNSSAGNANFWTKSSAGNALNSKQNSKSLF